MFSPAFIDSLISSNNKFIPSIESESSILFESGTTIVKQKNVLSDINNPYINTVVKYKIDDVEYNGYKFIFKYEMVNAKEEVVCTAKSVHVFVNTENKVVFVDKWNPELDKAIKELVLPDETK